MYKEKIFSCVNCKDKKCLYFTVDELKSPNFMLDFPASTEKKTCVSNAITYKEGNIIINTDSCIKCGICVYRCSEQKIQATDLGFELRNDNIYVNNKLITNVSKLIQKLKKNDSNIPNLLIRNLLITLGAKASILKKGVISIRTDLIGTDFIGEIEFGEDILESPRSILDDVAVLSSRYNINFDNIKTLVFVDKLPHPRSEYWEVVFDIAKITSIKIGTISVFYLLFLVWNRLKLNCFDESTFYIDYKDLDYRNKVLEKILPKNILDNIFPCEELDIITQTK